MKIKWIAEEREIPYKGIMSPGKVYEIDSDTAESLIRQKMAQEEKKQPKKMIDKTETFKIDMDLEG